MASREGMDLRVGTEPKGVTVLVVDRGNGPLVIVIVVVDSNVKRFRGSGLFFCSLPRYCKYGKPVYSYHV